MSRRGIPTGPVIWYLREWMAARNIRTQAQMSELTGWSKAKMSQLYNEQQDFNSQILTEAAQALQAHPWQLLMHPDDAHAIMRMRESALAIAADKRTSFISEPSEIQRRAG